MVHHLTLGMSRASTWWEGSCAGLVMKQPFEKVVEQHGQTVLRVCRVLLGVHDAEDAWSETFLAAMRAYPDLPGDANAEAWLVTIAHRKAIDVLRARQRQPAPVGDVPESPTALGLPGARTATYGGPSRRCRTNSARRWRITTWPAWPTPRSPGSSAAPRTRRAGPRPMASGTCGRTTRARPRKERQHDHQFRLSRGC